MNNLFKMFKLIGIEVDQMTYFIFLHLLVNFVMDLFYDTKAI